MNRFYCTRTPEGTKNPNFLKATAVDAIRAATDTVEKEGGTVYVVQVVYKVGRSTPPITVETVVNE